MNKFKKWVNEHPDEFAMGIIIGSTFMGWGIGAVQGYKAGAKRTEYNIAKKLVDCVNEGFLAFTIPIGNGKITKVPYDEWETIIRQPVLK